VNFRFPKSARLRTRFQYLRMKTFDQRHVGCYLIADQKASRLQQTRLGITVSRRFGKAHDRNRFKRIVREAFRLSKHQLRSGLDIHVKPLPSATKASMHDIKKELLSWFKEG
jgi:ribonuclease P protein component